MRTPLLAGTTLLAVLCLTWISPAAHAAVLLDQQYTGPDNSYGGFTGSPGARITETFTVGVAGLLSEVDVQVYPAIYPFSGLNILTTTGGTPTTMVAASGSFLHYTGDYALFSLALPVTVGEVLAIEPVTTSGADWVGTAPGTYAGGQAYFLNPAAGVTSFIPLPGDPVDHFRTYVTTVGTTVGTTVPEPASLVLIGTGLLGLGLIRRHRAT